MINSLDGVLKSVCKSYKEATDNKKLSKNRLMKLTFLVDWFHALSTGKQATSVNWIFDRMLVCSEIDSHIKESTDFYGCSDCYSDISFNTINEFSIPEDISYSLEQVISTVSKMSNEDILKLVYSTEPIYNGHIGVLKLESIAKKRRDEYRAS